MDIATFLKEITGFFNHPFFIVFGGLTAVLVLLGIIYRVGCWIFGLSPIVLRLGLALWNRKVAIFGSIDSFANLKTSLVDSKIIKEKNIIHIEANNIEKAYGKSLFLVDWDTFGSKIEQVFSARKNHQTSIIIYAKPQSIPIDKMSDIANRPNTVVVNFRGRLLNDVLTSLITTSYD